MPHMKTTFVEMSEEFNGDVIRTLSNALAFIDKYEPCYVADLLNISEYRDPVETYLCKHPEERYLMSRLYSDAVMDLARSLDDVPFGLKNGNVRKLQGLTSKVFKCAQIMGNPEMHYDWR